HRRPARRRQQRPDQRAGRRAALDRRVHPGRGRLLAVHPGTTKGQEPTRLLPLLDVLGAQRRRELVAPSATPISSTAAMIATIDPMMLSSQIEPVPSRLATRPPMTEPARPSRSVASRLRFCAPGLLRRDKAPTTWRNTMLPIMVVSSQPHVT